VKTILITVICIIDVFVLIYAYYGGFRGININIKKVGGEMIVYEEIVGDYKQSGKVMDKIYTALLNDFGIETFKGIGIYYDNPKKVQQSKLRSEAGCILEPEDAIFIQKISESFKIKELPKKEFITAEFPYKGKLSILFGIMKVYPAFTKYISENGLKEDGYVMEVYDIPNKKILYRKEIVSE